jgi:hypothetical protein
MLDFKISILIDIRRVCNYCEWYKKMSRPTGINSRGLLEVHGHRSRLGNRVKKKVLSDVFWYFSIIFDRL